MIQGQGQAEEVILVVDDNALHRKAARGVLEVDGFKVEEAADGKEGLAAVERCRPDLVLLDVMMPELDGFEVCTRLRRNPDFENLPILMVTALHDAESITRAFDVGATNFVTKPINWALFSYHVKVMLRASRIETELRRVTAGLDLAETA